MRIGHLRPLQTAVGHVAVTDEWSAAPHNGTTHEPRGTIFKSKILRIVQLVKLFRMCLNHETYSTKFLRQTATHSYTVPSQPHTI